MDQTEAAVAYVHDADLQTAPAEVGEHVRARLLDTLAAITAGYRFPGGAVTHSLAGSRFDGPPVTLLDGDGETAPEPGAVLANATAANVLDIDDGHRLVKGHPAAVVVPPALAAAERADATVGELLDAILVGYELGVRAGLAIHEVDGIYSGTGSWGALGAAAAVARLRGLSDSETRAALGTAEYFAPRTPISRGVSVPGMTKDGIGWGAYVGVAATDLAETGFTGSGTVFDEYASRSADSPLSDLGERYHVTEGYLKPYPCCRWAQPGVEAALALRDREALRPADIESVTVETFAEATDLTTRAPDSAEAAEYSYPYPVAAALVRGQFTASELRPDSREDDTIRRLADLIELSVDPEIDDRFPAECLARVMVRTAGSTVRSEITRARGARERPLDETERVEKARRLLPPTVDPSAVAHLQETLRATDEPITNALAPWGGPKD